MTGDMSGRDGRPAAPGVGLGKDGVTVVEGRAAGGAVVVRVTSALEAESVRIDRELADPNDLGMLEDAVLAAIRDALAQIVALEATPDTSVLSDLAGIFGVLDDLPGAADLLGAPAGLQALIDGLPGAADLLGAPAGLQALLEGLPGAADLLGAPGGPDLEALLGDFDLAGLFAALGGNGPALAAADDDDDQDDDDDDDDDEDDDDDGEA